MILLNGVDISTINNKQYRELVSVVFQDYQLFAFSVEDNIILNRTKDFTKIYDAISKSGLSELNSPVEKDKNLLVREHTIWIQELLF